MSENPVEPLKESLRAAFREYGKHEDADDDLLISMLATKARLCLHSDDPAAAAEWERRMELNREGSRRHLVHIGKITATTPKRNSLANMSPQERIDHVRAQAVARQHAFRKRKAAQDVQPG